MKSENITYFAQPKLLGVLKHQKLDRKPFRTSKISKEEFHILFSSSRNPSSFPREKKNPLAPPRLHQIWLFWYQSKEQTEETRFQLSKDVGVGEVKVENQKKVLATFFQRGKMAETGEKSCSASISGRRWPNLVVGAWMWRGDDARHAYLVSGRFSGSAFSLGPIFLSQRGPKTLIFEKSASFFLATFPKKSPTPWKSPTRWGTLGLLGTEAKAEPGRGENGRNKDPRTPERIV